MDALFQRIAWSMGIRATLADESKSAIMLTLADATIQALVVSHMRLSSYDGVHGNPVVRWIQFLLNKRLSDRDEFIVSGVQRNLQTMAADSKETGMGINVISDRARDDAFFAFHVGLKDRDDHSGGGASPTNGVLSSSNTGSSTVVCSCKAVVSLQRTTGGTSLTCEMGVPSTCKCSQPVVCVSCFFATITSRVLSKVASSVSSRGDFRCRGDCACVCADCGATFCIIGIGASVDMDGGEVIPYDLDITEEADHDTEAPSPPPQTVQYEDPSDTSDSASVVVPGQDLLPASRSESSREFLMSVMGIV